MCTRERWLSLSSLTSRPSRPDLLSLLSLLAAILLAGHGCSTDRGAFRPTALGAESLDRSSPAAVLASLQRAYTERSAADYESLLAVDFKFYFCERDAQLGAMLTREQEAAIHRRMFASEEVLELRLDFSAGAAEPDEARLDPLVADRNLWTATLSAVDLLLVRQPPSGPPIAMQVRDGVEQFWFRREERAEPDTGEPIWTIVEWREICPVVP